MIRRAEPRDVAALLALIQDLAEYERAADQVELTAAALTEHLFSTVGEPAVYAHVADLPDSGVAGMAIWFRTFSTWTGRHGIWLEDLYVRPAMRGRGLGRALLAALATEAVAHGWARIEWAVLDWNTPAIGFYAALGATGQQEWTTWRLRGADLQRLGAG